MLLFICFSLILVYNKCIIYFVIYILYILQKEEGESPWDMVNWG
jgi:hypothetical protein